MEAVIGAVAIVFVTGMILWMTTVSLSNAKGNGLVPFASRQIGLPLRM